MTLVTTTSNPQADKLTAAMTAALPAGARVCYMAGMTYPADRLPTVCVSRGVADARTYTWVVCDGCGATSWCSTWVGIGGGQGPVNSCVGCDST